MKDKENNCRPNKAKLACGYMLCRDNSERLISDAIILYNNKSYLSSINCSRLANEEIAKALMIWIANEFEESDLEAWNWFKRAIFDHTEKLKVLEIQIHNSSEKIKLDEVINKLKKSREQVIYVGYNSTSCEFIKPGIEITDNKLISYTEIQYSKKIHQLAFLEEYLNGKSTLEDIIETFSIIVPEET